MSGAGAFIATTKDFHFIGASALCGDGELFPRLVRVKAHIASELRQ